MAHTLSMIEPFLTEYDPSDLPSASVDPLGFERGYLLLVDKILPGLTSVANQSRYFAVLCAGASLAKVDGLPPREQLEARKQAVLRFERLWALANCLAADPDQGRSASGIRGVTYANKRALAILEAGSERTSCSFTMLSRQSAYGVLGMYGWVGHELKLIDRPTLEPTPDLGDRLAEAFLAETEVPTSVIGAALEDGREVSVSSLAEWGARAHVSAKAGPLEGASLAEALHHDSVRSRMARRLEAHPWRKEERELDRLRRVARSIEEEQDPGDRDLLEALRAILAYEESYALVQLTLERLLWSTRVHPTGTPTLSELTTDGVFARIAELLEPAVARLGQALDQGETQAFRNGLHRLQDERTFLERAASVCRDAPALARTIVERHREIQSGKWDGSRPKGPWLEVDAKARFMRTPTRVGGLGWEATDPAAVAPHPYRLGAVDSLIAAAKEGRS